MSLLNLACIAAAFAVVDGPFLQRASTVETGSQVKNITIELNLPPELPAGFSGYWQNGILTATAGPSDIGWEWIDNDSIQLSGNGCPGSVSMALLQHAFENSLLMHSIS